MSLDLNAYRAFVLAVEHGTITEAAARMQVSRPTLSRQLAALEEQLGLALLHRTTRRVRPTPRGRRLYDELRPLVDDLDTIEARLHEARREPIGWLRLSAPPLIAPHVVPVLDRLRRDHPKLSVELIADQGWADLHSDRIDVALRAGRLGDPSLVQRKLGVRDVYAVASPEYLRSRGQPTNAEALREHGVLRGQDPRGGPQTWWPAWDGTRIPVDGSFVSNDQQVLLQAALLGTGIALLSDIAAGPHVAAGRLQRVLPDVVGTALVLHAVYARRTLQPASVRACIDALAEWAASDASLRLRGG